MKMTTCGWQVPPSLDKVTYHRCSRNISQYVHVYPVGLLKSPGASNSPDCCCQVTICAARPFHWTAMGSSATAKALPPAIPAVIRTLQPWKPSTLEPVIPGTQPWNPPTLTKPADPGSFQLWNSSCKLWIRATLQPSVVQIAGSERCEVGKLRIPRLQASWLRGSKTWIVRRMVGWVQGWRVKIASLDGSWVEGFRSEQSKVGGQTDLESSKVGRVQGQKVHTAIWWRVESTRLEVEVKIY